MASCRGEENTYIYSRELMLEGRPKAKKSCDTVATVRTTSSRLTTSYVNDCAKIFSSYYTQLRRDESRIEETRSFNVGTRFDA